MHERRKVAQASPIDALRRRAKARLDHNFSVLEGYFTYAEEKLEREEAELHDDDEEEEADEGSGTFLTAPPVGSLIRNRAAHGHAAAAAGQLPPSWSPSRSPGAGPRRGELGLGARAARVRMQQPTGRRGEGSAADAYFGLGAADSYFGVSNGGAASGAASGAADFFGLGGEPSFVEAAIKEVKAAMAKSLSRILDLFRSMDADGDGMISREEFIQVLPLIIGAGDDLHGVSHDADTLGAVFDAFDRDQSGYVEYSELHAYLRKGADVELAPELQAGAMGPLELEARNNIGLRMYAAGRLDAIDAMGRPVRGRSGANLAAASGRAGGRRFEGRAGAGRRGRERVELRKISDVGELRAVLVRGRRRIGECFRVLDRNQDGKITKKEFAAALPLLGIDASSKWALDEIFDSIDMVI